VRFEARKREDEKETIGQQGRKNQGDHHIRTIDGKHHES